MELPFDATWWVEPGRLLGGCYPGALEEADARPRLAALHALGVRHIVCLQEEHERGRKGVGFAPYLDLWRELDPELGWERHSIRDMDVPTLDQLAAIVDAIERVHGIVYVHCWGGHGRTGTVAAAWLVRHRGLDPEAAFRHIARAREHCAYLRTIPSPQTRQQRACVHDFAERCG